MITLLSVVALTDDIPAHRIPTDAVERPARGGLLKGQVGTVVDVHGQPPEAFDVEFVDEDGETYALLTLAARQVMLLHDRPEFAAC